MRAERDLAERVVVKSGLVAGEGQLLALPGASPRTADLDEACAECDRATLGSVAVRGAADAVLAVGTDRAGQVLLHEFAQGLETEGHRERRDVLLRRAREFRQRERLIGRLDVGEVWLCDDPGTRCLANLGGPSPSFDAPSLADGPKARTALNLRPPNALVGDPALATSRRPSHSAVGTHVRCSLQSCLASPGNAGQPFHPFPTVQPKRQPCRSGTVGLAAGCVYPPKREEHPSTALRTTSPILATLTELDHSEILKC